ncbi:MAG TPA: hypothetical protein VD846_05490 [Allosphingosinicella sp.]|nr:hypothetical protein [Allosphingosinicella sp.]
MTKHSGGPTINQGGASKPTQEERDREFAGITGNVAGKGEKPSPSDRDRGETTSREDSAPIDIDTARDRAS